MQVEKINITKELIDMPEGKDYMEYANIPNFREVMVEEVTPSMMASVSYQTEIWRVHEVAGPYGKAKRKYLVKRGEQDLFTDLMEVTKGTLERWKQKIDKQWQRNIEDSVKTTMRETTEAIRDLPWWKRLFNKF